jgi:hypothetical protein
MKPLTPWTARTFDHNLEPGLHLAVLERLRGTPARAAALLDEFPHPLRIWRRPGSWSAHDHVGHLDDLHHLDLQRVHDFLTGSPTLTAADMTNRATFEAHHNATPTLQLIERLRRNRHELTAALDNVDEALSARIAVHPRLQRPMRIIDWMYFVAEHDDHHLARARETMRAAAEAGID